MRSGRILLLGIMILASAVPGAFAQRDTASVVGTVRDSSGASVPGATVTITNKATNIASSTTSDSAAEYVLTPLKVGTYRLQVEARGFARQAIDDIHLNVDQRLRLDINLAVGTLQQQVDVTRAPPALQTQDSTVGVEVWSRQMEDMPLNGSNFQSLAGLAPGAIPSYGGRDSTILGGADGPLVYALRGQRLVLLQRRQRQFIAPGLRARAERQCRPENRG